MYIKMPFRLCLNGAHCATVFPEELRRTSWPISHIPLSILGDQTPDRVDFVIDSCRGQLCECICQLVRAHICQDGILIFDLFMDGFAIYAQKSRSQLGLSNIAMVAWLSRFKLRRMSSANAS